MGSAATSLPMVDQHIIDKGPVLSHDQQVHLCAPCTAEEVREALFSMDSMKAPGIDGFNVHFYKNSWKVVGPSIIHAVQDFFRTGFMPRLINCTYVSLIPVANASSIKEFRPIACCSVLYKIISKTITNRM